MLIPAFVVIDCFTPTDILTSPSGFVKSSVSIFIIVHGLQIELFKDAHGLQIELFKDAKSVGGVTYVVR